VPIGYFWHREMPCGEPPGQATHWTGRAVAKTVGVSLRVVQRLWEANRLRPHRIRTFKTSNDPAFAEKVEDVVGLYTIPPAFDNYATHKPSSPSSIACLYLPSESLH